jgi:outer membrane receptor for ferrienterochelin and colicins
VPTSMVHNVMIKARLFRYTISIICFYLLPCTAQAQYSSTSINGKVIIATTTDKETPLIGAQVILIATNKVVYTNPLGEFTVTLPDTNTQLIAIKYKGFVTDTFNVNAKQAYVVISLTKQSNLLNEVKVKAQSNTTSINRLSAIHTYTIKREELHKAACCNLSESFETTPSVDVSFTDAITGQKQIQMLGLATPYTLITQENIPNIRGLAGIIGLNYTPGTWVQGMQLSKGTGSVVNGFESLAGSINVELAKPDNAAEQFYLNAYQNSGGRSEANANLMYQVNKQLSGGVLLHYKNQWTMQDHNKDGFADNPLSKQYIGAYRMQYFNKNGIEIQGIVKLIHTSDNGGTLIPQVWQYNSTVQRQEASLKIGKLFTHKPWKSIGWQHGAFMHKQLLQVPFNKYVGNHNSYYTNLIYQTVIGNTNHGLKLGASFLYDAYSELLPDATWLQLSRTEYTPGIYAEHTYNYLDKFTLVSGLRIDKHNLYGWFATPRIHLRWEPITNNTLRLSFGRAQRTASVFTEQQAAYFTNRQVILQGTAQQWQQGILPEVAYNIGASLTRKFKLNFRPGTFILDYYYSWFTKQIIADYEQPRHLYIYALNGQSFAHSLQAQADYEVIRKKINIRLAYRYNNIKTTYRNILLQKPLIAPHRAFVNIAYQPLTPLKLDATVVWHGSTRLPNYLASSSDAFFIKKYSPSFVTINAQASHAFNKLIEVYVGGENLGNYTVHDVIINAHQPGDANFDAAQVWGPVMGINIYTGIRWKGSYK